MATLSGNKIKNTYQSLVKFSDNGNITTSAKQLTDGFGNNSPMFVSTTQVGIGVTPESGLNLHVFGDAKIGSNLTVIGNLVVEGSTTTVGTDTLTVKDPLIVLANNNTSTDAVDIGFYGKYTPSGTTLYSGIFREALTGKYRLFKGLEVEPTTTVNTSGTGYAKADLIIGALEATTGDFSGDVDIDGSLDVDDVISVEGSAFGRIEIGGTSGGYIDLKAPNSDDYDFRIITSSGGNELTTASGDLIFNTAETLALTLDTSQDATFAGSVSATTGTFSGDLTVGDASGDTRINILSHANSVGTIHFDNAVTGAADGSINYDSDSGGHEFWVGFGGNDDKVLGIVAAEHTVYNNLVVSDSRTGIDGNATFAGSIILSGTVDGRDVATDGTKLDGIESGADVTDATNVLAAGAVMTTGNQSIAGEKTFSNDFTVTSDAVFNGNINLDDDERIRLGTSNAFQLYYDSTLESGQGGAIINSNRIFIETGFFQLNSRTGENMIKATSNGNVELYNNDSKKLETTSTGITVTGTVSATAFSGNITGGTGTFSGDLTVGTDSLFVDVSEDSVGIGLTNPSAYSADTLVINTPDEKGITLVSSSTEKAYIAFQDGTGALENFMSFDHAVKKMNFNVFDTGGDINFTIGEGVTKFNIDNTNVRVYDDLTVDGNSTFAGNVSTGNLTVTNTTSGWTAYINNNVGSGTQSGLLLDAGSSSADFAMYVRNAAGSSDLFAIKGNGNVGIGTASPTAKLHITKDNTSGNALLITNSGSSRSLEINHNADGTGVSDEVVRIMNNGTRLFTIESDGNVGIGTDSPQGKLNVTTGAGTNGAELQRWHYSTTPDRWNLRLTQVVSGADVAWDFKQTNNNTDYGSVLTLKNGNVGIGTASPYTPLEVSATDPRIRLNVKSGVTDKSNYEIRGIGASGYEGIQFRTVNDANSVYTSLMMIEQGGNVGIGTDSPQRRLTVGDGSGSEIMSIYAGNANSSAIHFTDTNTTTDYQGFVTYNHNLDALRFGTAEEERMRIDSSGNIGIGGSSTYGKLVISSLQNNSNDYTWLVFNNQASGYGDWSMYKSRTNSLSFGYGTDDGASYSNALTLEYGGNVGIGIDNPATVLDVRGGGANTLPATTGTTPSTGTRFRLANTGGASATLDFGISTGGKSWLQSTDRVDLSVKYPLLLNPNGGNVGIGTSDIEETLTIDKTDGGDGTIVGLRSDASFSQFEIATKNSQIDWGLQTIGARNMYFTTNGSERMRITSGGNILFGTQGLPNGTSIYGSAFHKSTVDRMILRMATSITGAAGLIDFFNPNGQVGYIATNGFATQYVTSSDYRLKENVVGITGALDRVSQLKPSRFNFIGDADKTVDGFLAHEVQEIVPEAISGEKDAMQDEEYEVSAAIYEDVIHPAIEEELDDDGNIITEAKEEWTESVLVSEAVKDTRQVPDYQGIDQSKLVPLLVAAIQELKAEVDKLKQECKCKN